jgi:Spy/CpxP family protein refolding chaperone
MTKRSILGFLIVCSVILNIVFIGMWMAHAAPRHFAKYCQYGASGNKHHACAMQKSLSINDSQWTILKPGIDSFREKTMSLCQETAKNRAELLVELEKTPTDSTAVSTSIDRIASCQKAMQTLMASHILEEKKLLTQDQKQRFFNALRKDMRCAGAPGMAGMMPCKNLK